jgi:large subunit ribosomal protein L28e
LVDIECIVKYHTFQLESNAFPFSIYLSQITLKMVSCPDSLVWELTRRNTSFMKKKNGRTKRSGAVAFSSEKGNLASLNLFKYSGLANSKVCDITCTDEDRASLYIKTASKTSQPKKSMAVIPMNKDFKRVESAIKKTTSEVFYRRDLEAAMLGKWTKVYQANRRAKGIIKVVVTKKGRGTL